jgi:hypothetical protein
MVRNKAKDQQPSYPEFQEGANCELLLVFYDSLTWLGLAGLARLSAQGFDM